MLTNKWIGVALGVATTLAGYLATVDWSTLAPSQAGLIISGVGIIKAILSALQPPASQATIVATGGTFITHT